MIDEPIKVIVVDDSAFIRVLLTQILSSDENINVVATAEDAYDAREKIKKYQPDVLTLDVEMPKMDGITFLRNLMRLRPMPVIMVSTLTQAGADVTLQALEYGAYDFVAKPTADVKGKLIEIADELISKVKSAALCNTHALENTILSEQKKLLFTKDNKHIDLVTIGASTGGTEAIQAIVKTLPDNMPPIVMAQHIPDVFSSSYAKRLNEHVDIKVMEVRKPQLLEYGHAYLAPGHKHMVIRKKGNQLWACLNNDEPVNRHKPAVDVLFDSVQKAVGNRSIAVLLTGMGRDGADSLLRLKQAGAITVVQDQESSVVWGMPGAAVKIGAASHILNLHQISEFIVSKL